MPLLITYYLKSWFLSTDVHDQAEALQDELNIKYNLRRCSIRILVTASKKSERPPVFRKGPIFYK